MSNQLLSAPIVEPVTLADMKAYARISHANDDALLTDLISGAREWCEAFTGRAFITQTWRCTLSVFPKGRVLILPSGPLQSITSVTFYNASGEASSFDVSHLLLESGSVPSRAVLEDNAVWFPLQRAANGMVVDYVVGYGSSSADVPAPLRLAIKQLVLHWYENREAIARDESITRVPMTVEALLKEYRVFKIGGSCV
ncbi:MAG: head-tail connector protein [Bdellovibrionales bacterium]